MPSISLSTIRGGEHDHRHVVSLHSWFPAQPVRHGLLAIVLLLASPLADAATRYVEKWGDDTDGPCAKSDPCFLIQDAIDASGPNDRIVVGPGTYRENLLIGSDKPGLKLESTTGRHATIIDAQDLNMGRVNGLLIQAPKVKVGKKGKGFTFSGANLVGSGIHVDVDVENAAIRIEGNRLGRPRGPIVTDYDNLYGLYVEKGGGRIQVRNNIFENNENVGFLCDKCPRAMIRENRFEYNGFQGLRVRSSDQVSVLRNLMTSNDDGVVYEATALQVRHYQNISELNGLRGVRFLGADGSRIEDNLSAGNMDQGILVVEEGIDAEAARITGNLVVDNAGQGIELSETVGARVESNTAISNDFSGIRLMDITSLGSLKSNTAIGNIACGIQANSGSFDNYKFFAEDNIGGDDCGDFTPTGSEPAKPGPLKIRNAAKVVGG